MLFSTSEFGVPVGGPACGDGGGGGGNGLESGGGGAVSGGGGGVGCAVVGGEGGGGGVGLGLGKVSEGGEMLLQVPSEHWVVALLLSRWWWRRRRPNPKTMPRTTRTVTMKMKIFVAFPT